MISLALSGLKLKNITESFSSIFAIGSFVGSYVGSIIEEKLALGNNMITAIIDPKFYPAIIKELKKEHYGVTILEGNKQNKIINYLT